MSTTAGAVIKTAVGTTTASVSSALATAGSSPVAYQWYKSTSSGFVPGAGNIISGATSLTLNDTGLSPGTQYYYKMLAIDSAATSGTSAQLGVVTAPVQSQNQFSQSPIIGMLDLKFNYDTISAEVDASQSGVLLAGQAVKIVDSAYGIPKVVACAANSDQVFGFINFDIKSASYAAGDKLELSQAGNVIYLISVGAIARGAQVQNDLTYVGGVKTITGSSGAAIVGYAYDKASGDGQLLRVRLSNPSFLVA